MAEWIAVGIFAVLVVIGMAWMLVTIKALRERMDRVEDKK